MTRDMALLDKVGWLQGWTDYPNDSIECGSVWHLDNDKTPFGRIMDKDSYNPLENDADAFRLMAFLCVQVRCYATSVEIWSGTEGSLVEVDYEGDQLSAIRRALVLTAALRWGAQQ